MKQLAGAKKIGHFGRKAHNNRHLTGRAAASLTPPDYGITSFGRKINGSEPLERKTRSSIQPKLIVGAIGDRYEQEADRVASEVVGRMASMGKQAGQKQEIDGEQGGNTMPLTRLIKEEGNSKDLMRERGEQEQEQEEPLGRVAENKGISPWLSGRIKQSQVRGTPLPSTIQRTAESKLGYNFDGVSVKTGKDAADMAQSLGAKAFTHGSDIWLGSGAKINDTRLMAHEIAHVVQQGAAPALTGTETSPSKSMRRPTPPLARVGITLKDHSDSVRMTPSYPNMDAISADATVEKARAEDWTAGEKDHKERSGWVMWDEKGGKFQVVGRKTGTWEGVNPGSTPGDSASEYCVGHYHQHPSLPEGKDGNKFPVSPSGADIAFANGRNNPGIVRDFKTKARTSVTNYKYGPNVRA